MGQHTGTFYRYFCVPSQHTNVILGCSHADFPSQQFDAGITYSVALPTQAHYPVGIPYDPAAPMTQQPAQDQRVTIDGHYYQTGYAEYSDGYSHTSGDQSTSASANDALPSENQQESQWDGQYYFPTTSYPPQEPLRYASELSIDSIEDDQDETRIDSSGLHQAGSARSVEAGSRVQQQPLAPGRYTQQNNQTANVARTPTARRWSREYSPEERIRVGLPRWETKRHRKNYERKQKQGYQRSEGHHRS
jgi:hypothetical protein